MKCCERCGVYFFYVVVIGSEEVIVFVIDCWKCIFFDGVYFLFFVVVVYNVKDFVLIFVVK